MCLPTPGASSRFEDSKYFPDVQRLGSLEERGSSGAFFGEELVESKITGRSLACLDTGRYWKILEGCQVSVTNCGHRVSTLYKGGVHELFRLSHLSHLFVCRWFAPDIFAVAAEVV